ncbi:MAG: hypothetical protein KDB24_14790 [Microthrixaceae bacterium]|nr:hypothetical protein [Microthrixaceae bacterium]
MSEAFPEWVEPPPVPSETPDLVGRYDAPTTPPAWVMLLGARVAAVLAIGCALLWIAAVGFGVEARWCGLASVVAMLPVHLLGIQAEHTRFPARRHYRVGWRRWATGVPGLIVVAMSVGLYLGPGSGDAGQAQGRVALGDFFRRRHGTLVELQQHVAWETAALAAFGLWIAIKAVVVLMRVLEDDRNGVNHSSNGRGGGFANCLDVEVTASGTLTELTWRLQREWPEVLVRESSPNVADLFASQTTLGEGTRQVVMTLWARLVIEPETGMGTLYGTLRRREPSQGEQAGEVLGIGVMVLCFSVVSAVPWIPSHPTMIAIPLVFFSGLGLRLWLAKVSLPRVARRLSSLLNGSRGWGWNQPPVR